MSKIFLSSTLDDMPMVTEYDHALWYSSIYTPDVKIDFIQNNCVNGYWPLPTGWANQIEKKLVEMKNRFYGFDL